VAEGLSAGASLPAAASKACGRAQGGVDRTCSREERRNVFYGLERECGSKPSP
jgi:hypothetical protein